MSSLTKSDLIDALNTTEKNILKQVDSKLDTTEKNILKQVDSKLDNATKTILKSVDNKLGDASDVILKGVDGVASSIREDFKTEISWVRNDIKDLEVLLSDKPSRKQFEEYKFKVDNFMVN